MRKKITYKTSSQLYDGNVTITLSKNGRPYQIINKHNEGTEAFFKYILKSLIGYNMLSRRPWNIVPCADEEGAVPITFAVQCTEIPADPKISSLSVPEIVYNFLIPENFIANATIGSFRLEAADQNLEDSERIYAILKLENPITITSGTNIFVNWIISISNGEEYPFNSQNTNDEEEV